MKVDIKSFDYSIHRCFLFDIKSETGGSGFVVFVRIEPETGTDLANSPRTKLYMRTSTINNNSISPKTVLTVRVKAERCRWFPDGFCSETLSARAAALCVKRVLLFFVVLIA